MFLLRLQLLNRVKREKKTPTLHCSSACAAAGKEADGRAVVSDAESIGRRVPAEQGHLTSTCSATQEDSLQPPWHLGSWNCAVSHPHAIRPASHLFLQTAPLPDKEDSAQALMRPLARGQQFPRSLRCLSACSCPSEVLASLGPPEALKVCWL